MPLSYAVDGALAYRAAAATAVTETAGAATLLGQVVLKQGLQWLRCTCQSCSTDASCSEAV